MKFKLASFGFISLVLLTTESLAAQTQGNSFSGRVEQVWEDGFSLNTNTRSIIVDTWDICGDNTAEHLKLGDQITITGEFEGGEFEAFSISKMDGTKVCRSMDNLKSFLSK